MARRRKRKRSSYSNSTRIRRTSPEDFEPVGLDLAPETKRGIAIIFFLIIAFICGMGILNLAGSFGGIITKGLFAIFGQVAFISPLIFLTISLSLFFGVRLIHSQDEDEEEERRQSSVIRIYIGMALFTLAITGLFHLHALRTHLSTAFELVKEGIGGGYLGVITAMPLFSLTGYWVSLVILIGLLVVSFLIAFNLSLHGIFRLLLSPFISQPEEGDEEDEEGEEGQQVMPDKAPVKINTMESTGFAAGAVQDKPGDDQGEDEPAPRVSPMKAVAAVAGAGQKVHVLDITPDELKKGNWKLPPLDLLESTNAKVESGNIEAYVKIIEKTLQDFNINVEMGEVNVGPTVTQFTFRPAVGVKLSQILALRADLALALAAPSLRIEAPIPGKSLVGIEVPNKSTALVRLRDLLASESVAKHASTLAFPLGRDVAGHPMVADFTKMPHLLVAGATGTGKSVCINEIVTSLLYRNSPEELRFIIIDPKRVDLTVYNGIPHLLTPVITDHKQAINALRWMVAEMDRRYETLSEVGKRNIEDYNKSTDKKLPYIVLVVDELADLMSVAMKDVEASIVRLAQMARAVGLHLLLATQRPSVNIITGLIKANITSRIAFAVASQVDSRTILDMAGADTLLGNGDMLYTSAALPKPKRIQGPFVSEQEVKAVVRFIKDQSGSVDYHEEILEKPKAGGSGYAGADDSDEDEEVIQAAIEEITRSHKASASLLQRRLKLGYARAARVLDVLEDRGLIGPADGAKPREIYIQE